MESRKLEAARKRGLERWWPTHPHRPPSENRPLLGLPRGSDVSRDHSSALRGQDNTKWVGGSASFRHVKVTGVRRVRPTHWQDMAGLLATFAASPVRAALSFCWFKRIAFAVPTQLVLVGRFAKISLRLLLATSAGLTRRPNCCVVWQPLLVARRVCVWQHRCSFLPVAPPCCAASSATRAVLRVFHRWLALTILPGQRGVAMARSWWIWKRIAC